MTAPNIWINAFPKTGIFQRQDLSLLLNKKGYTYSDETIRKELKKAVDNGNLFKVGRNLYSSSNENQLSEYKPTYSDYTNKISGILQNEFLNLEFSLFELVQLNEFVNHLIAHNTVFVSVESELEDFVFEKLKDIFPGKILINPTVDQYHRYWTDNLIVITKLVSQRPTFKQNRWQVRLETMLVDLFSDSILKHTVNQSEYPLILETAFHHFTIDERSLFRYAKRRTADKRIRQMIEKQTDIVLKVKEK